MKFTYQESVTMETYPCPACGMLFSMTADFVTRRRDDHKGFYCPQGHTQSFREDAEKEVLRREVDKLRQQAARLEDEKRGAYATANAQHERAVKAERAVKRIEKRVHAGVCPDCNRTFANVASHMKTKHGERQCAVPALKVVK